MSIFKSDNILQSTLNHPHNIPSSILLGIFYAYNPFFHILKKLVEKCGTYAHKEKPTFFKKGSSAEETKKHRDAECLCILGMKNIRKFSSIIIFQFELKYQNS